MIPVLNDQDFNDIPSFLTALNKARLANKRQWITYVGTVATRRVALKSYDTGYLQILRVDGIEHGGAMDLSVTGWKHVIVEAINRNQR